MSKKTIFRTFAIALTVFAVTATARADSYVKVTDADGKATTFALTDKPTVTFTTDYLVLTAGDQTVEYPLTDYRTFEFTNQTTGLSAIGDAAGTPVFSFGESLSGSGLQPGTRVMVYSSDGRMAGSAAVEQSGTVEIPLSGKTGVFIVKTSTKTFKFIKK